ncbi:MAG: heat-inducible transcriptional repressor HrcA [bacterium]|nr:heat-inducible transcriptional repressor HrcA [bacterium]
MSERHRDVLNTVVRQFILTAQPVSSLTVAGKAVGASSATIRNVMAELEAAGLLKQQHTSGGRIPTANGYRTFVNGLTTPPLDYRSEEEFSRAIEESNALGETILNRFASVLASASHLIGVVLSPRLDRGILEHIELLQVADERLLLVVTLREGMVKTIFIELPVRVSAGEIVGLTRLINERLSGVQLSTLQSEANVRLADTGLASSELVRLILSGAESLFGMPSQSIAGAGHALDQPEFRHPDKLKTVIELLEGKDILLHLLENEDIGNDVRVRIGVESGIEAAKELSCVTANYRVGDLSGTIGIIGPTRMDYPRQMALVGLAANLLSKMQNKF